jgi:hypothetical protein
MFLTHSDCFYRTTVHDHLKFFFFFSMALPAHSGPWPLIQFRNHFSQTVGLLGRVISPSQGGHLNTRQHKHRINTYTHQTFMPWVGFKSMIPASERAKTVHALDLAAAVTGPPQLEHVWNVLLRTICVNFSFNWLITSICKDINRYHDTDYL